MILGLSSSVRSVPSFLIVYLVRGSGAAVSTSVRFVGLKVEILTVSEKERTKVPVSMSMVKVRSCGRVESLI